MSMGAIESGTQFGPKYSEEVAAGKSCRILEHGQRVKPGGSDSEREYFFILDKSFKIL